MVGSVVHGLAGTSPPLRPCRTLAPTGPVLPIVSGAAFLCFAPGLQGSGLYTVTGRASQEKNHSGAAFALVGPKKGRRSPHPPRRPFSYVSPRWGPSRHLESKNFSRRGDSPGPMHRVPALRFA